VRRILSAVVLGALAGTAGAQDADRGKALYETQCLECHYERIHKRDPARSLIRKYSDLLIEVARRSKSTRQTFTAADVDDVAEYLDRSHYRFPR
jgi:mono/diheme cytochrome c family protein